MVGTGEGWRAGIGHECCKRLEGNYMGGFGLHDRRMGAHVLQDSVVSNLQERERDDSRCKTERFSSAGMNGACVILQQMVSDHPEQLAKSHDNSS